MANNPIIWPDRDFQYNAITYGFDVRSGMPIDRRFLLTTEQMLEISKPRLSIILPDNYFCVKRSRTNSKHTKLYVYNAYNDYVGLDSEGFDKDVEFPVAIGRFRLYMDSSIADPNNEGEILKPNPDGIIEIPLGNSENFGLVKIDQFTMAEMDEEGKIRARNFIRTPRLISGDHTEDYPFRDGDIIYYLTQPDEDLVAGLYAWDGTEYVPIGGNPVDEETIVIEDGKISAQVVAPIAKTPEGIALEYSKPLKLDDDNKLTLGVAEGTGLTFDDEDNLTIEPYELINDEGGLDVYADGRIGIKVDDKTTKINADGELVSIPEPLKDGIATKVRFGTAEWDSEAIDVLVDSETIKVNEENKLEVLYDNTTLKVENGLSVRLSSTGGLTNNISGEVYDGLRIKPVEGGGLVLSSEGVAVRLEDLVDSEKAIVINDNKFGVNVDNETIKVNSENQLSAMLVQPLMVGSEGIEINLGKGLKVESNKLTVDLLEEGGIHFTSEGSLRLDFLPDPDRGLEIDSNGLLGVKVDGITVNINSAGELTAQSVLAGDAIELVDSQGRQIINVVLSSEADNLIQIDPKGLYLGHLSELYLTSEGKLGVTDKAHKLIPDITSEAIEKHMAVTVASDGSLVWNETGKVDGAKINSEGGRVLPIVDKFILVPLATDSEYGLAKYDAETIVLNSEQQLSVQASTSEYNAVHIKADGLYVGPDVETIVLNSEGLFQVRNPREKLVPDFSLSGSENNVGMALTIDASEGLVWTPAGDLVGARFNNATGDILRKENQYIIIPYASDSEYGVIKFADESLERDFENKTLVNISNWTNRNALQLISNTLETSEGLLVGVDGTTVVLDPTTKNIMIPIDDITLQVNSETDKLEVSVNKPLYVSNLNTSKYKKGINLKILSPTMKLVKDPDVPSSSEEDTLSIWVTGLKNGIELSRWILNDSESMEDWNNPLMVDDTGLLYHDIMRHVSSEYGGVELFDYPEYIPGFDITSETGVVKVFKEEVDPYGHINVTSESAIYPPLTPGALGQYYVSTQRYDHYPDTPVGRLHSGTWVDPFYGWVDDGGALSWKVTGYDPVTGEAIYDSDQRYGWPSTMERDHYVMPAALSVWSLWPGGIKRDLPSSKTTPSTYGSTQYTITLRGKQYFTTDYIVQVLDVNNNYSTVQVDVERRLLYNDPDHSKYESREGAEIILKFKEAIPTDQDYRVLIIPIRTFGDPTIDS